MHDDVVVTHTEKLELVDGFMCTDGLTELTGS